MQTFRTTLTTKSNAIKARHAKVREGDLETFLARHNADITLLASLVVEGGYALFAIRGELTMRVEAN